MENVQSVATNPCDVREEPIKFDGKCFNKGPLVEPYLSGIVCDRFDNFNRSTSFFLTHVHKDHTKGLAFKEFANYLKQNDYKLYCSKGTSAFIDQEHPQLMHQTFVLELGQPTTVTVPLLPSRSKSFHRYVQSVQSCGEKTVEPDQNNTSVTSLLSSSIGPLPRADSDKTMQSYQVTVTTIEANHCFGAVMFLFEWAETSETMRRVLYTGDVRMEDAWFSALKGNEHSMKLSVAAPTSQHYLFLAFHNSDGMVKQIDSIYLDATFYHQPTFPSKARSCAEVMDLIKQHCKQDNFVVALSLTAKYNDEDIIMEIYHNTGLQVNVENDVYSVYETDKSMRKCITTDPWAKVHARRLQSSSLASAEVDHILQRRLANLIASVTETYGMDILLASAAENDSLNRCVQYVTERTKVLVIRPSAKIFVNSSLPWDPTKSLTARYDNIESGSLSGAFRVLASSHSSGDELREFLRYVKPREIHLMDICENDGGSVKDAERTLAAIDVPHIGDGDRVTGTGEIDNRRRANTDTLPLLAGYRFGLHAFALGQSTEQNSAADAGVGDGMSDTASLIKSLSLDENVSTVRSDSEMNCPNKPDAQSHLYLPPIRKCLALRCDRPVIIKNCEYCSTHHWEMPPKVCLFPGCSDKVSNCKWNHCDSHHGRSKCQTTGCYQTAHRDNNLCMAHIIEQQSIRRCSYPGCDDRVSQPYYSFCDCHFDELSLQKCLVSHCSESTFDYFEDSCHFHIQPHRRCSKKCEYLSCCDQAAVQYTQHFCEAHWKELLEKKCQFPGCDDAISERHHRFCDVHLKQLSLNECQIADCNATVKSPRAEFCKLHFQSDKKRRFNDR